MVRAAGTVAWDLWAFGKQIGIGCIGLRASWRQLWWCALLNVIEYPAGGVTSCTNGRICRPANATASASSIR